MPENAKHTPEPWVSGTGINHYSVREADSAAILAVTSHMVGMDVGRDEECEANAARIVACVNGCAGINPDAVPALLKALKYSLAHLDDVAQTRRRWTAADQGNFEQMERALALAHYLAI